MGRFDCHSLSKVDRLCLLKNGLDSNAILPLDDSTVKDGQKD